jgi:hypothetical protein
VVYINWPKQRHGSSAATSDICISGTGATLREAHDAAWVNFAKGLAKTALVGAVLWITLWNEHDRLEGFAQMSVAALLPATPA